VDNLTQITWASNIGTFILYGLTNLIVVWAFLHRPNSSVLRHKLVPIAGFLANAFMLVGIVYLGASAGGSSATDAIIALAMVAAWIVAGAVWFIHNTRKQGHEILTRNAAQLTDAELADNT
jgi:glucan phosphoethanolaminetransferase (alkaline phosphatase superfamily)